MAPRKPVIESPWGRYVRARRVFWRIRIPVWLAAGAAGWAIRGAAGLAGGVAAVWLAEVAFSYRRPPPGRAQPHLTPDQITAIRAERLRRESRWATHAAPSPAGWVAPPGSVPAWNWTPPDGITARLERVPAWVRVWYRTPFADRYAHAWMWRHGGWDVLPPGAGDG